MKAVDFLYSELETISKAFPRVSIKYGYNTIIDTHIVELLPIEEYLNNAALDAAWIPLSFKFRETFPKDEITFISSDSSLAINNPIFEFNQQEANCDAISELFSQLSNEELNYTYTFPTSIPIEAITISNPIIAELNSPHQEIDNEIDDNLYYQAAA